MSIFNIFKKKEVISCAVEQGEDIKNISEPVLTLVNLLQTDTERFEITSGTNNNKSSIEFYWEVLDKITSKKFTVRDISSGFYSAVEIESWMTKDEVNLLYSVVKHVYAKNKAIKIVIENAKARKEWMEIYCEDK